MQQVQVFVLCQANYSYSHAKQRTEMRNHIGKEQFDPYNIHIPGTNVGWNIPV